MEGSGSGSGGAPADGPPATGSETRLTRACEAVREQPVDDLLTLTAALVDVPSVSHDEALLADLVEARLRARAPHLSVERVENNVVARTILGRPRRIVLAGHLDTVPVNGNETARVDGAQLFGLGSADMKGGLAVMLALAEMASADPQGLAHDVSLVFYEGEEVADEFNGLGRLFAARPELPAGDFAIALEPTDGRIEAGCQGTIHLRVTTTGARAHSARPWMGANAIHAAGAVIERVAAFGTPRVSLDGLEFREAMQVVRVEGGIANNVVPDRCTIVVNRRYAPRVALDQVVEETIALLRGPTGTTDCVRVPAEPRPEVGGTQGAMSGNQAVTAPGAGTGVEEGAVAGAEVSVELISASGGAHPNLSDPLVAHFVSQTGLDVLPKLGWTDVARFAAHGVPAVNYGPGDPSIAHTAGEWVARAALERCHDVLARYLRTTP